MEGLIGEEMLIEDTGMERGRFRLGLSEFCTKKFENSAHRIADF